MPSDECNFLGPAVPLVQAAVELGSRATSGGDSMGAYRLYACTARLVRQVRGLSELGDFRLERALDESESRGDPAASAAVLLAAFHSLLPDGEPQPVPDDPLLATQRYIELAISIGAPAYNLDDRQGCYDVYSCTARMILATVAASDGANRLRESLEKCAMLRDPDKQAWAMRHGFDAVLAMSGPELSLVPSEVRQLLDAALALATPAFNLGDSRGCYEVYACTARLLLHSDVASDDIKNRLRQALGEAAATPEAARQALIIRQALDEVVGGGE